MQLLFLITKKQLHCFFVFALFFLPASYGFASVGLAGDTITVEGFISYEDADKFVDLAYAANIKKVIFRNSEGGSWSAGLRIGNRIAARGITTVVEGYCGSACAMAFLGGSVRELSLASPEPVLIYHLPFSLDTKKTELSLAGAYFSWIEEHTGKPINTQFKAAIESATRQGGGVYFYAEDDPNIIKYGGRTLLCTGDEKKIPRDCAQTETISAASLGFLTPRTDAVVNQK
jgi:hypothetical protein